MVGHKTVEVGQPDADREPRCVVGSRQGCISDGWVKVQECQIEQGRSKKTKPTKTEDMLFNARFVIERVGGVICDLNSSGGQGKDDTWQRGSFG